MGILKKKQGGSTRIPLPFFTVFNMGDPPTINVPKVLKCKINHNSFFSHKHVISKRGEGGGSPTWEKFPHFPVFFLSIGECLLLYYDTKTLLYLILISELVNIILLVTMVHYTPVNSQQQKGSRSIFLGSLPISLFFGSPPSSNFLGSSPSSNILGSPPSSNFLRSPPSSQVYHLDQLCRSFCPRNFPVLMKARKNPLCHCFPGPSSVFGNDPHFLSLALLALIRSFQPPCIIPF